MAFDTGLVTTPLQLSVDVSGDPIVIRDDRWILNRLGDDSNEVAFDAGSVSEKFSTTTTTVTAVDGTTVVDPGSITAREYDVAAVFQSRTDFEDLRQILDGDQVLLRGPHGEWDWVQVIGNVRARRMMVYESDSESRMGATLAETPWQAEVAFTLRVDTRWTTTAS